MTLFTPQPIGYVRSSYKDTREIPKGLGAKHDAEGVLEVLPEFGPDLLISRVSLTSSSCGYSITRKGSTCWAHHRAIIDRTACSPRGPQGVPTLSA